MLQDRKNNENILIRGVIAGLLDVLNNKITYNQNRCNEGEETVVLPWYYNQAGDERFMQDFYTHYGYCLNDKCPLGIDGNMDMIPRGVITYQGMSVDAGRITSRFVEGNYTKEINGKLETYTSYLFSIPVNVKFNAEIWIDSLTTSLKIEQSLIESLFKVVTTYFNYKDMRIGMQIGFPDSNNLEAIINYSFDTNLRNHKLTFNIEVETYLPAFDKTTESLYNNRIKAFGMRLYDSDEKSDGIIWFESPKSSNITLNKNMPVLLEWNYKDEGAIIQKVDLSYIYNGHEYYIEKGLHNNMSYVWSIPNNISDFNNPIIIIDETKYKVIKKPEIIITPYNNYITNESFTFNNNQRGIINCECDKIPISIEYKDKKGKVREETGIILELENNTIKNIFVEKPIKLIINDVSMINLRIYNTVNHDVYDEIKNIKVI